MRDQGTVSQSRKQHAALSQKELGKILSKTLRDYIDHKIELYELIEVSETIRRHHMHECSKSVAQAVTTLYLLNENLHNPTTNESAEKEIDTTIDKTLAGITG